MRGNITAMPDEGRPRSFQAATERAIRMLNAADEELDWLKDLSGRAAAGRDHCSVCPNRSMLSTTHYR
jgi:hypothetical protein